jgi:hypothetical protein
MRERERTDEERRGGKSQRRKGTLRDCPGGKTQESFSQSIAEDAQKQRQMKLDSRQQRRQGLRGNDLKPGSTENETQNDQERGEGNLEDFDKPADHARGKENSRIQGEAKHLAGSRLNLRK